MVDGEIWWIKNDFRDNRDRIQDHRGDHRAGPNASFHSFSRLLSVQILLGGFIGEFDFLDLHDFVLWKDPWQKGS